MNRAVIRTYLNIRSAVHTVTSRQRPPRNMPADMVDDFTMNGTIPVLRWYVNDAVSRPLRWTKRQAENNQRLIEVRKHRYYGQTDSYLYHALDKHSIAGKQVVIVGSESPWYECICLHYGARVTTIEYRDVACEIPGITVLTPDAFQRNPRRFDVVLSISSIEHDGLGRYGDPINPRGDLQAMDSFRDLLKPEGRLVLAVPVGREAIVWNAHRIYGRQRLPLLLNGWEIVDAFGFTEELFEAKLGRWDLQPVFVLSPKGDAEYSETTNWAAAAGLTATHSSPAPSSAR